MGSETTPSRLPIIDFSSIELKHKDSPTWDLVKTQVKQALEEYGCFELLFPKISLDLRKALFGGLEELFDLPLETKLRNYYSPDKPSRGYIGAKPQSPLYESLGIDDAPIHERTQAFIDMLWPEGNPNLCTTIQSYSEQLSELDQAIRTMVCESFGLEKYLDEHLDSTNYLLRVMRYKSPQTKDQAIGLGEHTDKNIVTIVHQDEVGWLELQARDGRWVAVHPSPDSYIVFAGDSLHAWMNGRMHSPYHRVMMTGDKARYSAALFSIPKAGYTIKAPEELVDEEHPLLFKPFDQAEYLQFYYKQVVQGAACDLTAYCGV